MPNHRDCPHLLSHSIILQSNTKINIDFPIPYSVLKFAESAKNHTPTGPSPSIIIIIFQGPMNTTYLDFY